MIDQQFSVEDFGAPSLQIRGLRLWIAGRQFPDADDELDGNWLVATAHCEAIGASVWVQGAIVMVTDIATFGEQCSAIAEGVSRSAVLDPHEPELKVSLETVDPLGHIRAQVQISPDHLTQSHSIAFEIDTSYLSGIIEQCDTIVAQYPFL
jgi:hypothetical protein